MRARAAILLLCLAGVASAGDPKPTTVDAKPFRDKLLVFEDTMGGTYLVLPTAGDAPARVFFAKNRKTAYEQIIVTRSTDEGAGMWSYGVWAPRVSGLSPASIQRNPDGSFIRFCGDDNKISLKPVAADRAKQIVDKMAFMSSAIVHRAHLFARDDAAVYYYVDMVAKSYGGAGYRVFVGKKGAMKQLPLTDVATDSAGEVYSTKSGDMRIVTDNGKSVASWIKGEKRKELSVLDLDVNSHIIYSELGVYQFLGTVCDEL
ncbi:MAG: hypothetical protein ABI678_01045 [Kofleriaceae bacterium]